MPATKISIEINAPRSVVYEVITDFESYPNFLRGPKQVVVQKSTAKSAIVNFTVSLIKKINYTLEIKLSPEKGITWKLVEGDSIMKKNSGKWKLTEKKGLTHAEYQVEVDLGNLPKPIAKKLVEGNLPTMMKSFRDQAEKLV